MDVPCQSFAAVDNGQRTLALISDCKYGFRLSEGVLSCSLINTAGSPDPYPERGLHRITLWMHVGEKGATALRRHSEALNRPLIPLSTKAQAGVLPAVGRLMEFDAQTALLSGAEINSEGEMCVRVYETQGKPDEVRLILPFEVAAARLTDMKGNERGTARSEGHRVIFKVPPYSIVQVCAAPKAGMSG